MYGLNEAGAQQILSGSGATTANRLFDSDYIFSDTYEHTNDNSNIVAYAIMLRKTSTPGQEVWINITPSDVPNNVLMVVESPLTIDTFEPYVTPTDEAKQDKPVTLWEAAVSSTGVQTVALSALSQPVTNFSTLKVVVCNCFGDTTITDTLTALSTVDIDQELNSLSANYNYTWCTTLMSNHYDAGVLYVDRIHVAVNVNEFGVTINGFTNDSSGTGIPGTFIRKIIGIP